MKKETFAAVVQKTLPEMSEERMRDWVEAPGYLKRALQSILCPELDKPDLKKIGKIVRVKVNKQLRTVEAFREAFMMKQIWVGPAGVDNLLENFAAVTEDTVDLLVVSVAELGFQNTAMVKWVLTRAQELGLGYCPVEVGLNFILQQDKYQPQPEICICTQPVPAGSMQALVYENRGNCCPSAEKRYVHPTHLLYKEALVAFVLPPGKA